MVIAESEDTFVESHAKLRFLQKGVAMGDDAEVPEAGIAFNRVTRTAHQINPNNADKSGCGLVLSPLTYEVASGPYALDGCSLCWRPGCCNWLPAPVELPAGDLSENECAYSPTSVVSNHTELDGLDFDLREPDDGF
jgi:hypothetical protein